MRNLLRLQLQRNATFLVVVMLVIAAFEFFLCAVVASIDVEAALGQMSAFAPPIVREMIEQNMPGGTPAGVLAFGWNHPVVHALLTAVAIALAARAIAGEIENGAIELVMTEPISRTRYLGAHALFGAGAIAAVVLAGILGTVVGQQVYSIKAFEASRLAALFANLWLLQLAIYAFTLAISAFGREMGRVALGGVLFAVISFLVNAIATLWNKAHFMKPWSLHGYFDPRDALVQGHLAASSVLVLAVFAAAALAVAFFRFARRDLP